MKWVEWFFSGIGTYLVSVIIGMIIGAIGGYKIGIKKSCFRQTQKARDNAIQIQNEEIRDA